MKHPTPMDKIIGERLKRARISANLSQSELGAMLKLTYQQIQKYERGTNRISASRLQEICVALNLNTSYFLREVDNPVDFVELDKASLNLVRLFKKIPNEKLKKQVLSLVKQLTQ